jgi:hypothetical protein
VRSEQASSGGAAFAEGAAAAAKMQMAITREMRLVVESMLHASSVATGVHSSPNLRASNLVHLNTWNAWSFRGSYCLATGRGQWPHHGDDFGMLNARYSPISDDRGGIYELPSTRMVLSRPHLPIFYRLNSRGRTAAVSIMVFDFA